MLKITHLRYQPAHKTIISVYEARLHPGEVVAILGPNGAGKSSLMKLLASEWVPTAGQITLYDKPLAEWPRQQRAQQIAVLPQSSQLTFPFSAFEVVQIGTTPLALDKHDEKQICQYWMEQTDCWEFANRIYTSLSGGERQRVQLARVLVQLSQAEQSPVLLLDEPTSAQDLQHQHQMLSLLKTLSRGQHQFGIIVILHDLNQASRYADTLWLLAKGNMISAGKPDDILQTETIHNVWGYQPEVLTANQGHKIFI